MRAKRQAIDRPDKGAREMNWRKSSYSGGEGNCVEVADSGNRVLMRDTQDRTGPVIKVSLAAWRRFAEQVKRSLASRLSVRL
jgi:hypothetical protein